MIRLTLPFPISVNALYSGMQRRHKSKRYQKWEIAAQNALRYQTVIPIEYCPLQVTFRFKRPDRRRRDVFNYEKICSDFLVSQKIIPDDCMIHRGVVEWDDRIESGVEITIEKL